MENSALCLVFILLIIVSVETTYQAYLSEYNWFRHRIEGALLSSRDRGAVPSEEVWEMDPEPARVWCLLRAISDVESTTIVTHDPSQAVGGLDFQDARFPAPSSNADFRGIDWRNYSGVAFDKTAGTCSIRCGTKNTPLTLMPREQGQQLMSSATLEASPRTREPYALARDEHGVYYYVDRGIAPEQRQSFRVWVGKKGELKLQKMKDIAADSEGEVFSTASGDLRFITSSSQYTWVHGKQRATLTKLPIDPNLGLIYNTLGLYTGQRLGTPCDVL